MDRAAASRTSRLTLKSNIFLWVFLATVVPLTALALGATYYSQRSYQREVQREVSTSLTNLGAEIDRRLLTQREVVASLAGAPAVQAYLPILHAAADGHLHDEYRKRSAQLNHFLEEMETILPGIYTIRVLDDSGNTLLKVSNGHRSAAVYDSLSGIPYAEQEINDPAFTRAMKRLVPGEVSFVALPHHRLRAGPFSQRPMYDYITPLSVEGERVGMLAVTVLGERIDRIIDHAPRLYKGKLFIAEVNPDNPKRNGYLLYDDALELHLAQVRPRPEHLQDHYGKALWDAMGSEPYGVVHQPEDGASIYYVEVLPYSNLLVSWIIATRIDDSVISAPFKDIRRGIWIFAAAVLVISLLLANIGARKIARPVRRLAQHLKAYADGDRQVRIPPEPSVDELSALSSSFNYMTDTLEHARDERDRAQHMMLQNAKLASIGQMAAGIGHEINNPLSNILSLAKLIERGLPPDAAALRGDLSSLREETLRASTIVKGILNFARQVPPHYAPFDVTAWLDDTLALVRREAKNQGVALEHSCEPGLWIEGDRNQLQQALINLLLNAIHASPRGESVSVAVRAGTEELRVDILDRGPGIAAEQLDKVFDPFYTTKPVGEGSGLGLSISLGIVEHHEGRLRLEPRPEGGMRATITLPRHRPESAAPDRGGETESPARPAAGAGGGDG